MVKRRYGRETRLLSILVYVCREEKLGKLHQTPALAGELTRRHRMGRPSDRPVIYAGCLEFAAQGSFLLVFVSGPRRLLMTL